MPVVTPLPESDNIKLAVVIGGHPYDVPAFNALFNNMPGVDAYIDDQVYHGLERPPHLGRRRARGLLPPAVS